MSISAAAVCLKIFGSEVAAVLHCPAAPIMSIILLAMAWHLGRRCLPRISFVTHARSSLPPYVTVYTDSDQCLCTRSHSKASDILGLPHPRLRLYLQLVGTPVLCDIWLAYSPYINLFPVLTLEFILEFEYGSAVVQALSRDLLTLSEHRKLIRRES
ncbi:hypothetical protein F4604DRAFT_710439 [Suillus subluteus]|nr:hypothetical protein F4604DRAFT_710439 [Suillus subluteus]